MAHTKNHKFINIIKCKYSTGDKVFNNRFHRFINYLLTYEMPTKNVQINCMIQLFIKNHKPLPCKHLNHHKLIYTADIVLHIFPRY